MQISFQKQDAYPALGIEFFWKLTIKASPPITHLDHFIPELFYDYLFIKSGQVECADPVQPRRFLAGQQFLKTLSTKPVTFRYSTPLVLLGARLSLKFAEGYWDTHLPSSSFLEADWISRPVRDLSAFSDQLTGLVESHLRKDRVGRWLSPTLAESRWLASYSPRQKRRLYQAAFGLSRKQLQRIRSIHSFLEQTCDFAGQNPRIIRHVNVDAFYDQPHLNRSFKKVTGFTPLEYFEASSILQDNLMAASYNAVHGEEA